jgi:hypothetical protein
MRRPAVLNTDSQTRYQEILRSTKRQRLPIPVEVRNSGPVTTIKIEVEILEGWASGLLLINNYVNKKRHNYV